MKRFAIFFLAMATGFSQAPRPTAKELEVLAKFMMDHRINGGKGFKLEFIEKFPHPLDPVEIYFPKDTHNDYHIYFSNTSPQVHAARMTVSIRADTDPQGHKDITVVDMDMDGVVDLVQSSPNGECAVMGLRAPHECSVYQEEFNEAVREAFRIIANQKR